MHLPDEIDRQDGIHPPIVFRKNFSIPPCRFCCATFVPHNTFSADSIALHGALMYSFFSCNISRRFFCCFDLSIIIFSFTLKNQQISTASSMETVLIFVFYSFSTTTLQRFLQNAIPYARRSFRPSSRSSASYL